MNYKTHMLFICLLLFSNTLLSHQFEIPDEIKGNVAFWKKIYSEISEDQVVFYNRDNLAEIYLTASMPAGFSLLTPKEKEEAIDPYIDEIQNSRNLPLREKIGAKSGLKERFIVGLINSGSFMNEIKKRFTQAGLPAELSAIIFVESLFNTYALSKAGAAGIWQFMPNTAKSYLHINNLVDERYDPILATEAAIKFIAEAKRVLLRWPLVITAYNCGIRCVNRAIQALGSDDYAVIFKQYDQNRFGFAVRNYYSEFLAALELYENYNKYFPDLTIRGHLEYDLVALPFACTIPDIVKASFVSLDTIKNLNPALKTYAMNGQEVLPAGFVVRMQKNESHKFAAKISSLNKKLVQKAKSLIRASHIASGKQTLAQIAKIYDVFVKDISQRLNLKPQEKIKRGRVVRLLSAESRFSALPKPLYQRPL